MPDTGRALQCKSDERGAFGSIAASPSIASLKAARQSQGALGWNTYTFATNADYTGSAIAEIYKTALGLKLSRDSIVFLGPQYWSDLCEEHISTVEHMLDFRLRVSEEQVIEAFRSARYFEHKLKEYEELIRSGQYHIELGNNRLPIRLRIPFSAQLTIEHCLDVAMSLLGITLAPESYPDLATSARASVSITVNRIPQPFKKKLSELNVQELAQLQLWITIVFTDELEGDQRREWRELLARRTWHDTGSHTRIRETTSRYESALRSRMWNSVVRKVPDGSLPSAQS